MPLMSFPWFRDWQKEQQQIHDTRGYAKEASFRVCDQLDDVQTLWNRYPDLSISGYEGEIFRCQTFHQFYTAMIGMWSCSYSYFVFGWRGHDDVLTICRKLRIPELETKLLEGRELMRQFSERELDLFDAMFGRGVLRGTGEKMSDPDKEASIEDVLRMHYARWWYRRSPGDDLHVLGPLDLSAGARQNYSGDPVLVALAHYVDAIIDEHPAIVRELGPAESAAVPSRIENERSHMVAPAERLLSHSRRLLDFFSDNELWLTERKPKYGPFTGGESLEDDTPHSNRILSASLFTTKSGRDIVLVTFCDGYLIVDVENWTEIGRVMEGPNQYKTYRSKYQSIHDEIQFDIDLVDLKIKFGIFWSRLQRRLVYRRGS